MIYTYELQVKSQYGKRFEKSIYDEIGNNIGEKIAMCAVCFHAFSPDSYRVVKKQGNKIIEVVYPKKKVK